MSEETNEWLGKMGDVVLWSQYSWTDAGRERKWLMYVVVSSIPYYCGGVFLSGLAPATRPEYDTAVMEHLKNIKSVQLAEITNKEQFEKLVLDWLSIKRRERGHILWIDNTGGRFHCGWKLPEGVIECPGAVYEKVIGPPSMNWNSGNNCYVTTYYVKELREVWT